MAYADGAKIFVIGGKPDDPFWSIVKKGAEVAGKVVEAQGGSVTWLGPQNYDNLGVDAAELTRQAIDQGATGQSSMQMPRGRRRFQEGRKGPRGNHRPYGRRRIHGQPRGRDRRLYGHP